MKLGAFKRATRQTRALGRRKREACGWALRDGDDAVRKRKLAEAEVATLQRTLHLRPDA